MRWCTNSIGSSMVRMWPLSRLLMSSIIAASVVDLPEPVLPVTRISPLLARPAAWHGLRQLQLVHGQRLGRNGAEHRAHAVELAHHVDAEAAVLAQGVGEVRAVMLLEALHRLRRHDFVQRVLHEVRRRGGPARSGGRSPYRRMRGGSPAMKCRSEPAAQHLLQVVVDLGHARCPQPPPRPARSGR